MYYQDRGFDPDWLLVLLSLCVLAFAVLWQPGSGDVLAEGFRHVLVVGAEAGSNVTHITLWSPADANLSFDGNHIPIPAGESRVSLPLSGDDVRFCVEFEDLNDCGVVFIHRP